MKGDTSVNPTERPKSKFMIPSQQPALTLVASAAAEDSRSQLITSAIAPDDQVVCMKSTSSFDQSITSSPSTIFEYTCLHFAPALRYLYFSDGPARTRGALCSSLARTTVELCSSPEPYSPRAASSNPLKTDAASPTAAVPLGKLHGSECSGSTGTACTSSGALGCSAFPATPREIPGPRPEDLRGRHRSRLFETTSTLGEMLGDERYPSQCAWKGTRLQYFNMGKAAADPSREGASPEILSLRQEDTRLWPEEDFRGRHRSRLFEATSTLGEVLGGEQYPSQCAWMYTRQHYFNMGKTAADPSGERALARRACFGGIIFSSKFSLPFLEWRPDSSSFRQASLAMLHPRSYHPLPRDRLTLVAFPLIPPRPRMSLSPASAPGRAFRTVPHHGCR